MLGKAKKGSRKSRKRRFEVLGKQRKVLGRKKDGKSRLKAKTMKAGKEGFSN
ncbi:hypothetical protein TUM3792_29390 [Shewanella sp. MBTL60-007]|nr:hypothetical protein TUM3792_29390 [Shewanella sp. MBTL60-007]